MADTTEVTVRGRLVDYPLSQIIGGYIAQDRLPYVVADLVVSEMLHARTCWSGYRLSSSSPCSYGARIRG
jgi:hypothetical protein